MSDQLNGPTSATSTEENNGALLDVGMGNGFYEATELIADHSGKRIAEQPKNFNQFSMNDDVNPNSDDGSTQLFGAQARSMTLADGLQNNIRPLENSRKQTVLININ